MEERIRLTFDDALNLVSSMTTCTDVLDSENDKLQHNFKALHDEFRDVYYDEFADEFKKGDIAIKEMCDSLTQIGAAVYKYTTSMMDNA